MTSTSCLSMLSPGLCHPKQFTAKLPVAFGHSEQQASLRHHLSSLSHPTPPVTSSLDPSRLALMAWPSWRNIHLLLPLSLVFQFLCKLPTTSLQPTVLSQLSCPHLTLGYHLCSSGPWQWSPTGPPTPLLLSSNLETTPHWEQSFGSRNPTVSLSGLKSCNGCPFFWG